MRLPIALILAVCLTKTALSKRGIQLSKTSSANGLNFLVIGDWGGRPEYPYYTPAESALAKVMGNKATEIGSQFTLALGDNFYDTGVKDVDDKRFKDTFENVFTASSLQTRWYVICGNHDHYGNCSAEIAYTKRSSRWYFPDFYYKQEFSIPGTSLSLKVVFIDTVLLTGLTHPLFRSLPPGGPQSWEVAQSQWDWINSTLAEYSKSDGWTIVVGHYPVWSVAEHGPTKDLVEKLKPMLETYGVSAYYCGHDHNLQHINDTKVQYYVVGAGHLIDPSMSHKDDVPKNSLKFYYGPSEQSSKKGGFASVSVNGDTLTTTFFDYTGQQDYQSVIHK